MQIKDKKVLKFYLMADRMMNRGKFKPSIKDLILDFIAPDVIMQYLTLMRKVSFYSTQRNCGRILYYWYRYRFDRIGLKLGFSIGFNCFGYGLVIPHY